MFLPTVAATVVLFVFLGGCEIDCGDAGARGLFLYWLATTPIAFLGILVLLRTSANPALGWLQLTAGQIGSPVGYLCFALSLLPLSMAAASMHAVLRGSARHPEAALLFGGFGIAMAVSSVLIVLSARSLREQAVAARQGRPWGM